MNDAWKVAAFRAVLTATLVGLSAALTTWSQTDSLKLIALAGLTPAVGILIARLGVEGGYDSRKP